MSTPNFNIINAHRVYAVFDRDPEEGYERDEYDIRDMLDDFVGCLNENTHHPHWHGFKRVSEHAGDRNYPVLVWARRTVRKTFGGMTFDVDLELTLNSGYWGDASLDWDIVINDPYGNSGQYSTDWDRNDGFGWLAEDFCDEHWGYHEENPGMAKIQKPNLEKAFDRWIKEGEEMLEEICSHFAEKQAVCLGVFSNGEAIYEEVA